MVKPVVKKLKKIEKLNYKVSFILKFSSWNWAKSSPGHDGPDCGPCWSGGPDYAVRISGLIGLVRVTMLMGNESGLSGSRVDYLTPIRPRYLQNKVPKFPKFT